MPTFVLDVLSRLRELPLADRGGMGAGNKLRARAQKGCRKAGPGWQVTFSLVSTALPQPVTNLESTIWIPREAFGDEVDKQFVIAFEYSAQALCSRTSSATFAIDHWSWRSCRV